MSKLRSSTFFWAPSIRRLTILLSMASPSCIPSRVSTAETHSPANLRIRSSSSDRKKRDEPGVSLAAGAAAELVVDAAALVPLGADDVQAADRGDLAPLDLHLRLVAGDGLRPRLSLGTSSRVG